MNNEMDNQKGANGPIDIGAEEQRIRGVRLSEAMSKDLTEMFKDNPKDPVTGRTIVAPDAKTYAMMMAAADRDGDGIVPVTEMRALFEENKWIASTEAITAALKVMDVGGDGLGRHSGAYKTVDGEDVQIAYHHKTVLVKGQPTIITRSAFEPVPEFTDGVMVAVKDRQGKDCLVDASKISAHAVDKLFPPVALKEYGIEYARISEVVAQNPSFKDEFVARHGADAWDRDVEKQRGRRIHDGTVGDMGGAFKLTAATYRLLERELERERPVETPGEDRLIAQASDPSNRYNAARPAADGLLSSVAAGASPDAAKEDRRDDGLRLNALVTPTTLSPKEQPERRPERGSREHTYMSFSGLVEKFSANNLVQAILDAVVPDQPREGAGASRRQDGVTHGTTGDGLRFAVQEVDAASTWSAAPQGVPQGAPQNARGSRGGP